MSINRTDAQALLTVKQFDAWDLHERGMSPRTIAHALGITRSSVIDRLAGARHSIRKHQQEAA